MLEKISKICLYILVLLAPLFFLPLTVSPVVMNKQVLVIALTLISFVSYLISSLESKKIACPKSLVSLSILGVLIITAISAIFSDSLRWSFWGNFDAPDSLLFFLIYGAVFYLAAVLFNREDLNKIGLYFFTGLGFAAVLGFLQLMGQFIFPWDFAKSIGFNTIGTFGEYGVFVSFGLVMIAAIFEYLNKWQKIAMGLTGLLIIAELIIINNQFIWIGLALTLIFMAAWRFAAHTRLTLPLVVLILSLFFIFFGSSTPVLVSNLPIEIKPSFSSTVSVSQEILRENGGQLLLGSGQNTFGYKWNLFRPMELNQTDFWQIRFNQGFNFILTFLGTGGILGVLAILLLVLGFIKKSLISLHNHDKELSVISFGIFFLIVSLFLSPMFLTQAIFIFLGLGLINEARKEFSFEAVMGFKKSFAIFIFLIVLIVASSALFFMTGQKYASAIYYEKGVRSILANDIDDSLIKLDKARAIDPYNDLYYRYLSQILIVKANELAKQLSDKTEASAELKFQFQNIIAMSASMARQAAVVNQNDYLNWSNLANVYENLIPLTEGADKFALESYQKASERDPKNPNLFFRMGVLHYNKNEIKEAKEVLEKAIAMSPEYTDAHYLLGFVYDKEGKKDKAILQFEKISSLNPANEQAKKILSNLKEGRNIFDGVVPSSAQIPQPESQISQPEELKTEIQP